MVATTRRSSAGEVMAPPQVTVCLEADHSTKATTVRAGLTYTTRMLSCKEFPSATTGAPPSQRRTASVELLTAGGCSVETLRTNRPW